MSSLDRLKIELLIDLGTSDAMVEDMVSTDLIEFYSEEKPYRDRIYSYQRIYLIEAVKIGIGIGQVNGIPIAVGVMNLSS